MKKKTIILLLMGCTFFGVGLVSVLFLMSEEKMQRNNAFQRRYVPHPIEKIGEYVLEYNSFYLAGFDEKTIYLGNYNAPLYLMSIDYSLNNPNNFRVSIDSMHLPYQRVKIAVHPPYFYLGDGTVPIIFKGTTDTWKAKILSFDQAFFHQFVIADTSFIGLTTISNETKKTALGSLQKVEDTIEFSLNSEILANHSSGTFDSDGMLLWNEIHQKFLYTYYYKNSFEVVDKNLKHHFTVKTIDTISKPILDVALYTATDQYKLGSKTVLVNKHSSSYGDYLFIQNERLGKYEDESILQAAGIIDVYHLENKTYEFSFYLYHQANKTISDFKVYKDHIVAIVDNTLWIYRLKPQYFNEN